MAGQAVIYVRISRDKAGSELGVQRQETDCRELAARLGLTVREVYADNDISAASGRKRPAYRRMLADLASAPATVLCWHTDRLHRRPPELEEYVTLAENRGIATHAVKAGKLDLATPSGRMVARMLGAAAAYEVEHMRERQKNAKRQAAARGAWRGGRRPFGYEADGITLRPAEADLLHAAAVDVIGGAALASVARRWNAAGVTTTAGGRWVTTDVNRVLRRARNAALIERSGTVPPEITGPAGWPAIISETQWRALCRILSAPGRRTSPGPERRWLLSGIAVCGVCGEPLAAGTTKGSGRDAHRVYRCRQPGRHVARACAALDGYVEGWTKQHLRRADAAGMMNAGPADTRLLDAEIAAARLQLDELAAEAGARRITARGFAIAETAVREEIAVLEARRAGIARPGPLSVFAGKDPAHVWPGLDISVQRAVVTALLERVIVNPAPLGRPAGWRKGQPYFDPDSVILVRRDARGGAPQKLRAGL